jgi:hypothetical protein
MSTPTNTTVKPAAEQTPAVGWINPMRRMNGELVTGCYNLVAKEEISLMPGQSLFVAQTKNGSYVVKCHRERPAQMKK